MEYIFSLILKTVRICNKTCWIYSTEDRFQNRDRIAMQLEFYTRNLLKYKNNLLEYFYIAIIFLIKLIIFQDCTLQQTSAVLMPTGDLIKRSVTGTLLPRSSLQNTESNDHTQDLKQTTSEPDSDRFPFEDSHSTAFECFQA